MTSSPRIFDNAVGHLRRERARVLNVEGADFLLAAAVDDLMDRLATIKRGFGVAVDIGTPTSLLAESLRASAQVGRVVRLDRHHDAGADAVADPEALPLRDQSADLIVSALALQTVNDLPGIFAQARRALRPDGLFLATLLGGETLFELRQSLAAAEAEITGGASPRVAPFAEIRAAGALLQRAGLALPVTDVDRKIVRYDSALHLMRDLRAMGATNSLTERSRNPLPRAVLFRAIEIYAERFSDPDGRVRATFDLVFLSGWAPDESQQKPLRPGSAKVRLADALNAVEQSAGEKTGR